MAILITIVNIRPIGSNVGNHAIHFAIRKMLYEVFGRLVSIVEIPANRLDGSGGKGGISSTTVHEINRIADGVIVGGGNLFENGALEVDPNALQALRPPLMLFSNSWGRIYDRFGELSLRSDALDRNILRALVDRADISLSRDSTTHNFISEMSSSDQLGWCPTINLSRFAGHLPELPESERPGALISVRTPELMNVPYGIQASIRSQITHAISALKANGHRRVRILCNDSRDLEFAHTFAATDSVDAIFAGDVYEYLSLIHKAEFLVSYRLHASLPAMSFGTPVLNLTYDERAEVLIRDLGVQDSSINLLSNTDLNQEEFDLHVGRGGFSLGNYEGLEEAWEKVSDFQYSKFREFQDLVRRYVSRT